MTKKKLDERHRAQAARPTKTQRRTTTESAVRKAQTARPTRTQKRMTTQDAVKKAVKSAAINYATGGALGTVAKSNATRKMASNANLQKAVKNAADMSLAAGAVRTGKKVASNPTVQKAVRGAVSGATFGAVKPDGGNKTRAKATTARTTEAAARKAVMKRAAVTDGKALYEEIKKKSSKRGK